MCHHRTVVVPEPDLPPLLEQAPRRAAPAPAPASPNNDLRSMRIDVICEPPLQQPGPVACDAGQRTTSASGPVSKISVKRSSSFDAVQRTLRLHIDEGQDRS